MMDIVVAYDLAPHPEGGWFRETWRSPQRVTTGRGDRAAGTSVLYLLGGGAVSRLHRLAWDEVWHWHRGDPLWLHLLDGPGARSCRLDAAVGQRIVPAGTWFGAESTTADGWSLVGCTMAPGFDPADFELADRRRLLAAHPEQEDLVVRLTVGRDSVDRSPEATEGP